MGQGAFCFRGLHILDPESSGIRWYFGRIGREALNKVHDWIQHNIRDAVTDSRSTVMYFSTLTNSRQRTFYFTKYGQIIAEMQIKVHIVQLDIM